MTRDEVRELNAFKQTDVFWLRGGIYYRHPSLQNPGRQNHDNLILNFLPKISLKTEMGKMLYLSKMFIGPCV